MKKPVLLSCLLLSMALTACGGGGDGGISSSGGDRAQIVATIESLELEPSADDCHELETTAYVEQVTHQSVETGMQVCEEIADATRVPDSLDISKVEVSGSKATAIIAFSGGSLNEQAVVVAMRKEDGEWKLDRLVRFAKLDRPAVVKSLEKVLQAYETGPRRIKCVSRQISKLSTKAFEAFLFESNFHQIRKTVKACL